MRCVGVDFGGARIGLAVGEAEHGIASPRGTLQAAGVLAKDAAAIAELATREHADSVVIGLPLDVEGETKMAAVCRKLGKCIESHGLEVYFVDESFTSAEAELEMRQAGLKGSERRRASDPMAACKILERFFEQTQ